MGVSTFRRSSIVMGKDGDGKDILAYGITSGAYMRWNAALNKLQFIGGADMDFGSFATPLVVNQTNNYPLGIFGEISVAQTTGSTVQRSFWSRLKMSASVTAPTSVFGAELQARWADGATTFGSGTENCQLGGAWLYLEQDTTGQALADYAHASGVVVQVETFGALTIPTNAHLSGVQIESRLGAANGEAISLNSGTIAGLFITKSPAASGVTAQNWPYGIFIEECDIGIHLASTQKIQFLDAGIYIHASVDGKLLISSDGDGADDITLSGSLTLDDYITAACTSPGNGRFTMQQNTLIIGGDHAGQTVTALRLYTQTSDGTGREVGNFYGARVEATLKNADDTVGGLMAGLQIVVDLNTWDAGVSPANVTGLDIVHQETGTRATAPMSFIAMNDNDYDGDYPVAYVFDLGGLLSEISTGAGKLYHNETLKIKVNTAARYIPLSTAEGTYTTAYPIVSTYSGKAIDVTGTLAAAGEGMLLTLSETGTHTSDVKGIKVAMTKMSGAITGAGAMSGISAEVQARANAQNVYAYNAYTGISDTPTLGYMSAFHCYCDDLGSATASYYLCADLNIDSTHEASNGNYFIRMYAHGGPPTAALYFPSSVGIDNLIYFEQFVAPLSSTDKTSSATQKIAVKVGAGIKYLRLYDE